MSTLEALNKLEMSSRETKTFSVDLVQYLQKGEKVIGVSSVVFSPAGGPAVSNITFASNGKTISFLLTGNSSLQTRIFSGRVIFTTEKSGIQNTVEANLKLTVNG